MARWIKSTWKFEDLQGKTVEFETQNNNLFQGKGRFQVFKKTDGRLWILVHPASGSRDAKLHLTVDQETVDRLRPHETTEKADYLLAC